MQGRQGFKSIFYYFFKDHMDLRADKVFSNSIQVFGVTVPWGLNLFKILDDDVVKAALNTQIIMTTAPCPLVKNILTHVVITNLHEDKSQIQKFFFVQILDRPSVVFLNKVQ